MRACLLYNLQCKCAIVAYLSCRMPGKLAFSINEDAKKPNIAPLESMSWLMPIDKT